MNDKGDRNNENDDVENNCTFDSNDTEKDHKMITLI